MANKLSLVRSPSLCPQPPSSEKYSPSHQPNFRASVFFSFLLLVFPSFFLQKCIAEIRRVYAHDYLRFRCRITFSIFLLSFTFFKTSSFVTLSIQFIFTILRQIHISRASIYITIRLSQCPRFCSIEVESCEDRLHAVPGLEKT